MTEQSWMQTVPAWPGFKMEKRDSYNTEGMQCWAVSTNTGRPVTPVFTMLFVISKTKTEDEVRPLAESELWGYFKRAHPNGCPGAH